MSTASPVRHGFQVLENRKTAVLNGVAGWSEEQLRARPSSGGWSALEVLDHLVRVEKASVASITRNLNDSSSVTLRDRLGAMIVILVMRLPTRIKVPSSAAAVMPSDSMDLSVAVAEWNRIREKMESLLSSLTTSQLKAGVFQHPVSGWMTIDQALKFLDAHLVHHVYQLDRLKRIKRGADSR